MNASLPEVTIPNLTPDEKEGLKDYWNIYEKHREDVTAQLMQMARQHPEFKYIMQNTASQPSSEEQSMSRELQRNAVLHNDWEPYLRNLQRQGMGYAQAGLSFRAWFEIVAAFRKFMIPHLLNSYGQSSEYLLSAMNGMDTLIDIALSTIGDAYLETKEQLIRRQQEAVRDAIQQRESEKKFRGLLEAAPDAMVVVDQQGIIQVVNSRTEKMFGYDRSEIVRQAVEVLVPGRFQKKHALHREGYYGEHPVRPMGIGLDLFGLRKDGSEFPIEISLSPLETEDGLLVSAAIRDVTQRKLIEENVQKLNEDLKSRAAQLEGANKELEAFAYSVSHDLRAPLRTIDGFSLALLEDYAEQIPNEGQNYLMRIRTAAQRMAQLIDDLLNLSGVSRATIEPQIINLSSLAHNVVRDLQQAHRERIVEIAITPDLVARGDQRLMRIVLENLINNAWKYTSKQEYARIEFGVEDVDHQQIYFVRDNGAGFDMNYANKLFGTFQRLHANSEFPGIGIGLAIVQRIIHRHRGHVWAEGTTGKGATFYFTLGLEE
jgi:PAS domain S-box-containing protein